MISTTHTRPRYTPKNIPLILTLWVGSWAIVSAGFYLFGVGFLTLLDIIGGVV
jgi:hypothetical protein